jgi:alpha-ribazole phosphatase
VRAPGGEGWHDLAARVEAAVTDALRHGLADLVVVAHMGPILAEWARATGLAPVDAFAQRIDNLSLTVIEHGASQSRGLRVNHRP